MSNTASLRFTCNACGKSYAYKAEYANKKVKCKCGAVIAVPDMSAPAEEDLYDVADDPKPAAPVARPVRAVSAVQAMSAAPARGGPATRAGAPTLGYRGAPTAAQRQRAENALLDMKRDIYVPSALIAGSFIIMTVSTTLGFVRGEPVATSIAFTVFSLINALLMIGGALLIGGKVGISFGDLWTAILKFVAIALFVGMVTTIIDARFGMLGMAVLSIAASAVLYTLLFMYLFNMDAEDSIWMVCFFIGLRTALSWLLLPVLLGYFASGGTAFAGGGGGRPTPSTAQRLLAERIEDNKELGLVEEAAAYIKGGRQSYWSEAVDGAYAAGAEYVGFCVVRDINGKGTPTSLVFEMPDDPQKRAAVVKALNDFETKMQKPEAGAPTPITDPGGQYLEIDVD